MVLAYRRRYELNVVLVAGWPKLKNVRCDAILDKISSGVCTVRSSCLLIAEVILKETQSAMNHTLTIKEKGAVARLC